MEGKQPKLTPEQREAIDTLSSTPQYQGESKIKIFMKIPAKDKAAYSRTHFLVPLLAAVIVIALGTFVIVRLVSPVPRPALYAAAVSGSTPMGEADKLKDDYAKKLGKDVIIDDYFDMNKDGLSKLQTMIGNEQTSSSHRTTCSRNWRASGTSTISRPRCPPRNTRRWANTPWRSMDSTTRA